MAPAALLLILGFLLLIAGTGLISVPVAFIVAGAGLVAVSVDLRGPRR